jgi:hypothetical protein
MPSLNLDIVTGAQIAVAIANFFMAFMMWKSIKEIRKDRKRSYLEKRLEEFYLPLINLFSSKSEKSAQDTAKIEEIIVSKRYLCEKRVAKVLPQHFEGFACEPTHVGCSDSKYFYFHSEEELKKWIEVANTIWEEYIDVLKEYYKIIGIKHYVLPKKPEKWMFEKWRL